MEYRFAQFRFEPFERRLVADGKPIDVSSRYLDALALLLSQPGKLVAKDRFMEEVWAGVPVTDEALTQAIRALRKALGDDASNPRFIETVPRHGYRFIGQLDASGDGAVASPAPDAILPLALSGAVGGAVAGVIGGIAYGAAGGGSLLLVLVGLTALLGLAGGGAIGLGIGIARRVAGASLASDTLGGAAGGLIVGAIARLFGIDAFTLLFGAAPTAMTGASEGLLLGAATGLALTPAFASSWLRGALAGAVSGMLIAVAGGRLMAGSLALLDRTFPGGALSLEWLGLFGPEGLSIGAIIVTALEGALYVGLLATMLERAARPSA